MNAADNQYLNIMQDLIDHGDYREGRNGNTYSLFGRQMRFNLAEGFPILTTKAVHFRSVLVELLWFLRGDTNVQYLHDNGVTIWDEWADENGDLGPVYGKQWRSWVRAAPAVFPSGKPSGGYTVDTVDQIANVIESLKVDPYSRRHLVSAWNPADVDDMALPPCHCLFQFYVSDGKLSCQLYQRSADWFLGVPFNIASYALLTHLVAEEVGLQVGEFIHTFGDLHLYANHIDQAREQIQREQRALPTLFLNRRPLLNRRHGYTVGDILLVGYNPHPPIKAEVSK